MLVLGIESSTMQGGVALVGESGLVAEYTLNVEVTHSERLLPALDRLLQDAGVTLETLQGLAVSIGPGSFTGLRIGLSTAKGLAYATGLPLVGVPTLEVLAWSVPYVAVPVCPVLDARKQEVYAALYRYEHGALSEVMEAAALPPETLCAKIRRPTLFLGDGLVAHGDLFRRLLGEKLLTPPAAHRGPRPASVAELGRQRLLRGERDAAERLVPLYLRPSEAELRLRRSASAH